MQASWRLLFFATAATVFLLSPCGPAGAQTAQSAAAISDGVVKIGLLLDMSGPYSDTTGIGSATAAKMAVEDFGGRVLGAPIEIVVADHENRADRAAAIARDWFTNQHVDAIMDVTGSSEALIVQAIAGTRQKIISLSSAIAERLSNEACTATSIHYAFDTHAIANTIGAALVARGDDTWFFITVDYSYGYDLERDTSEVVEAHGAKVLGRARHPLDAHDFESYLARGAGIGAKAIGLANGGTDLSDSIKQAARLGMIPGPQVFAGLGMRINAVHSLGLETDARHDADRELLLGHGRRDPGLVESGFSTGSRRCRTAPGRGVFIRRCTNLQAVAGAGNRRDHRGDEDDAGDAHRRHLLRMMAISAPTGSWCTTCACIRSRRRAKSHYPWDYFKLVATSRAIRRFAPLAQSKCPLVKP